MDKRLAVQPGKDCSKGATQIDRVTVQATQETKLRWRVGFLLFLIILVPFVCRSKEPAKRYPAKAEFDLRILADKENYVLNERLFVRVEFTNVTAHTLCFPEPAQGEEIPTVGFITVVGSGPHGRDSNHFLKHFDGSMPTDDRLLFEMEHSWIRLGPNQIYVTKSVPATFDVDLAGEWQISAAYYPPIAPFDPKGSRKRLGELAAKIGCTPPRLDTWSPVTKIQVLQPSATPN